MRTRGRPLALILGLLACAVLGIAVWIDWPWIRFRYRFEPLGLNAQGFPEYRHRQTGIVMVRLPGGKFWMGAQRTDPNGQNYDPEAKDREGPVHEVTLSPFMIGKYEVTQGQWKAVMGSNPSEFKGDDDRPVENVSWEDIQEFERRTGLSLPTEGRWEYACRAGTTTPFAGTGKLDDMGWYAGNSGRNTHTVCQKAPNRFGLYDMQGNVGEACEDVYDPDLYGKPDHYLDPISTKGSGFSVFRGGSWLDHALDCRSTFRGGFRPLFRRNYLGLRPAAVP